MVGNHLHGMTAGNRHRGKNMLMNAVVAMVAAQGGHMARTGAAVTVTAIMAHGVEDGGAQLACLGRIQNGVRKTLAKTIKMMMTGAGLFTLEVRNGD